MMKKSIITINSSTRATKTQKRGILDQNTIRGKHLWSRSASRNHQLQFSTKTTIVNQVSPSDPSSKYKGLHRETLQKKWYLRPSCSQLLLPMRRKPFPKVKLLASLVASCLLAVEIKNRHSKRKQSLVKACSSCSAACQTNRLQIT